MWTRKNLKEKAKGAFKANYWKTIFVTFVVAALVGGIGYSGIGFVPSLFTISITDHSGGYQESAYDRTLNSEGLTQQELDALVGENGSGDVESIELAESAGTETAGTEDSHGPVIGE